MGLPPTTGRRAVLRGSIRRTRRQTTLAIVSDSEPPAAADRPVDQRPRYAERLTVPWWWWVAAAVFVGLVGYEIQLAARQAAWSIVGYVIVGLLVAAVLWSLGRPQVVVTADRELRAGKARLPRSVMARGAVIPPSAKSAAMGRQLDPAAFLMHHAWVKSMVLLVLDDPDDPTPYWLVSTRHPEKVLAALDLTDAAAPPTASELPRSDSR